MTKQPSRFSLKPEDLIQLSVLGGASIEPVTPGSERLMRQPKRLALFVYLTLYEGAPYVQRDQLLALFWPESDLRAARHALSQALYVLRQAFGPRIAIAAGDSGLHLDRAQIWCDALEFRTAVDRGEAEKAMALYRGELLPAFHLAGCGEFERWLENTRSELQSKAVTVGTTLIDLFQQDMRIDDAIELATRVLTWAPYDEGVALRVMGLHAARGEVGVALESFKGYRNRLQTDLELDPSEEIVRQAAQLQNNRARMSSSTGQSMRQLSSDHASSGVLLAKAVETDRVGRRRTVAYATLMVFLAATAVIGSAVIRNREVAADLPVQVAIFPFQVRSAQEHDFLRQGLADLLGTTLGAADGLSIINPRVFHRQLDEPQELDTQTLQAAARRIGADAYVLGTTVAVGEALQMSAGLYSVDGDTLAYATKRGAVPELPSVVDALAVELIAGAPLSSAQRLRSVASLTTPDLDALLAYLDAEQAFREELLRPPPGNRFPEALAGLNEAIRRDSSFALALYRLATISEWNGDRSLATAASRRALDASAQLPRHYQLLIRAYEAYMSGDGRRAERLYRSILDTHPNEPDAVAGLAEVLFHHNLMWARPTLEAKPWLDRALALGPHPVLLHRVQVAAMERDWVLVDSLARALYPTFSPVHWLVVTADDANERTARIEEVVRGPPIVRLGAAIYLAQYDHDLESALRVARIRRDEISNLQAKVSGLVLTALLEAAAGRPGAARSVLDSVATDDPTSAMEYRSALAIMPWFSPDSIDQLTNRLRPEMAGDYSDMLLSRWHADVTPIIWTFLNGRIQFTHEDRAGAAEAAAKLQRFDGDPVQRALASDLAATLLAEIALSEGRPGAAIALLEGLQRILPAGRGGNYFNRTHARILMGMALEEVGRLDESLAWYRSIGEFEGSEELPFLAPMLLRRARVNTRLDRLDEATGLYRRFLHLWADVEFHLQPMVDSARTELHDLVSRPQRIR